MMTAEANGSPLILACDPDADRLAMAERHPVTKKWKIFSGNEMGALFSWWAFKNYKDKHPHFDGNQCGNCKVLVPSQNGRNFWVACFWMELVFTSQPLAPPQIPHQS